MIKRIQVSTFLKQLGEGISEPLVILGDDNERYILKNQKIMFDGNLVELDCMFLNEILSSRIAMHLKVPVPDFAIAELDKRILENGPSLRFVHRFTEGIHFASKEIANTEHNLEENYSLLMQMGKPYIVRTWNKFYDDIVNGADVAKIIAFDLLIANFDRYNNTGNLLIANTEEGRKIISIDHGHAFFGSVWTTGRMSDMRAVGLNRDYFNTYVNKYLMYSPNEGFMGGLGEVFRAIESKVELSECINHSFKSIVHEIESISETDVDEWFKDIPDSWFKDKNNQIGFYKHFILKQKDIVRHLIQIMAERRAFTNYRGGDLQWIEKHVGTV